MHMRTAFCDYNVRVMVMVRPSPALDVAMFQSNAPSKLTTKLAHLWLTTELTHSKATTELTQSSSLLTELTQSSCPPTELMHSFELSPELTHCHRSSHTRHEVIRISKLNRHAFTYQRSLRLHWEIEAQTWELEGQSACIDSYVEEKHSEPV